MLTKLRQKFKDISKTDLLYSGLVVAVIGLVYLLTPLRAFAGVGEMISSALGWVLVQIVALLAKILLIVMGWLVGIFEYGNFFIEPVTTGWKLVRDLCNMFFVLILLIIAFSTILKISSYHYKSTLVKLLLMAIFINFSMTILGFLIDFSQVIMLTFVHSFRDAMVVNLTEAFGLKDIVAKSNQGADGSGFEVLGAMVLAIVFLVVAIFTMVVYAVVLLYRIISLWIMIILSPLAFFAYAVPGMQAKVGGQYWGKFWTQLTTGPVIAFFMWLALLIISKPAIGNDIIGEAGTGISSNLATGNVQPCTSAFCSSSVMFRFVIGIALLLIGLQQAQQAGGFAGSFAGKAMGALAAGGAIAAGVPLMKKGWEKTKGKGKEIGQAWANNAKAGAMNMLSSPITGAKKFINRTKQDGVWKGGVVGSVKSVKDSAKMGIDSLRADYKNKGVWGGIKQATKAMAKSAIRNPGAALFATGAVATGGVLPLAFLAAYKGLKAFGNASVKGKKAVMGAQTSNGDLYDATGNKIKNLKGTVPSTGELSPQDINQTKSVAVAEGSPDLINVVVKVPELKIAEAEMNIIVGTDPELEKIKDRSLLENGQYYVTRSDAETLAQSSGSHVEDISLDLSNDEKLSAITAARLGKINNPVVDSNGQMVREYSDIQVGDSKLRYSTHKPGEEGFYEVDNDPASAQFGALKDPNNMVMAAASGASLGAYALSKEKYESPVQAASGNAKVEELEKIVKQQKSKSSDVLREELKTTADPKYRQALALAIAETKDGFDGDEEAVKVARGAVGKNPAVNAAFEKRMEENGHIDHLKNAKGDFDVSKLIKAFEKNKIDYNKLSMGSLKTASVIEALFRTYNKKIIGVLDSINKNVKSGSAMNQGLRELSKAQKGSGNTPGGTLMGTDLEDTLRREYGERTGEWSDAYQDNKGTFNQDKLLAALRSSSDGDTFVNTTVNQISSREIAGTIGSLDKKSISLIINTLTNAKVSETVKRAIVSAIKDVDIKDAISKNTKTSRYI